jgi:hypothetical protein
MQLNLLMSDSELEAPTVSKDADDSERNFEGNGGNIHDDEDGLTSDLTDSDHIPQVRVHDALIAFANT